MQTIIIKLDPAKLTNPDLDLIYRVPERIEAVSQGVIQDNGYDYLENQVIGLWLQTDSAEETYPLVVTILQEELFLENDLSTSAELYISGQENAELENCQRVFP